MAPVEFGAARCRAQVDSANRLNYPFVSTPPMALGALETERRAPEGLDQAGLGARPPGGQEPADAAGPRREFGMPLEVERQGVGGGLRLVDQRRARRQGRAEQVADDLVVGAAQDRPVRRAADARGD